jgi:hypothetical protein
MGDTNGVDKEGNDGIDGGEKAASVSYTKTNGSEENR